MYNPAPQTTFPYLGSLSGLRCHSLRLQPGHDPGFARRRWGGNPRGGTAAPWPIGVRYTRSQDHRIAVHSEYTGEDSYKNDRQMSRSSDQLS